MSYTNLLLINKTLSNIDIFINSCNDNTFPLVYSVPDIKNASGLLSSRINPKNFMIKTITDTKKITIKSDKVYNRVVKENWIKVA